MVLNKKDCPNVTDVESRELVNFSWNKIWQLNVLISMKEGVCEKGERQRCSTNISFLQQLSREESNFSIKVIRENYICHKKLVPNRLQNLVESSMHTKCLSLALLTMYMSLTRNILQFRERVPYNLELLLGRQKKHIWNFSSDVELSFVMRKVATVITLICESFDVSTCYLTTPVFLISDGTCLEILSSTHSQC